METNEPGCLLFYSLVCSICIFPVPSPLLIFIELMYIFYFHILVSNGLLKADFFFPHFFVVFTGSSKGRQLLLSSRMDPKTGTIHVSFLSNLENIHLHAQFFLSSTQIMMVLPFLPGFVKQVSWSTCIKRESKKVGSGHSDHKVLK